jgi:hypothetical protein
VMRWSGDGACEREREGGREEKLGYFPAWVGMERERRAGVGVLGGEGERWGWGWRWRRTDVSEGIAASEMQVPKSAY